MCRGHNLKIENLKKIDKKTKKFGPHDGEN